MSYEHVPSTWKRLFAFSLDEILMIPFYFPFLGIGLQYFWGEGDVQISLLQFFLILMVPAVYEFVFLLLWQKTPAKWFFNLKVVPADNWEESLTWQQCLLRTLTKRLSVFVSSAIYALALFRYDRTHLADWVGETRVVQETPRPQRPKIRWILGTFFVIYFAGEGLVAASKVSKAIDWANSSVSLSDIQAAFLPDDSDFSEDDL